MIVPLAVTDGVVTGATRNYAKLASVLVSACAALLRRFTSAPQVSTRVWLLRQVQRKGIKRDAPAVGRERGGAGGVTRRVALVCVHAAGVFAGHLLIALSRRAPFCVLR